MVRVSPGRGSRGAQRSQARTGVEEGLERES